MNLHIVNIIIKREYLTRVKKKSFLITTFLVPILFAVLCTLPSIIMVMAKEESKKDETKTLEKITVTGSLLKRLEYDTTSPVQVLTADTSVDAGQINTAEFLQKSSVAAGSTQISNQFAGFVVEGGTGALEKEESREKEVVGK